MSKCIVYTKDGNCCIIYPTGELSIEEIVAKDVPAGCECRIVDKDIIPSDRTFRAAWTDENPTDTIDVDMEKARIIHMDNIRAERNKRLADLDFEFMKAVESDDDVQKKSIAGKKQSLRDIPATFDLSSANTPEELINLKPNY